MTETPPVRARRTPLRLAAAILAVGLMLAFAALWMDRRNLAREALTGWLRDHGAAADVAVEDVSPSRLVARLSLGDPAGPDFTTERMEVRYRLRLSGVEVTSVVLRKPILRARLHAGEVRTGAVDPLIAYLRAHPPPPGTPTPRVVVEGGTLFLAGDLGHLRLAGDLVAEDGKLTQLTARTEPAALVAKGYSLQLGPTRLNAHRNGARLAFNLSAPVNRLTASGVSSSDGVLTLAGETPYPDLTRRRLDGAVHLRTTYAAKTLGSAMGAATEARATGLFDGHVQGGFATLGTLGKARLTFDATSAEVQAGRVGPLHLKAASDNVRWTRAGGERLTATLAIAAEAQDLMAADLSLAATRARFTGALVASVKQTTFSLTGSVDGHGGWSGLGDLAPADVGQMAAIKRAVRDFAFAASDIRVSSADGVRLVQPLILRPTSGGGEARLAWDALDARLTIAGGGLPDLDVQVRHLAFDPTISGDLTVRMAASLGLVQGGTVEAAGRLLSSNGQARFFATRCAVVRAARLDFDANDVEGLSARICPDRQPLFTLGPAGWTFNGRVEGAAASVPFAQARAEGGGAVVSARGQGADMRVQAQVTSARLVDIAPERRFNPLILSGPVNLDAGIWRADLALRPPGGANAADVKLTHDGRLGFGAAVIETPGLTFVEGGLQPDQLSPLAGAVGSPAMGEARFSGRFDWSATGATSRGTVTIPRLDFTSPAGPVRGLKGTIVFTSLAPLTAAPGQTMEIDEVQAMVLLTHLKARFTLVDRLLKVEGGEAELSTGHVRIEQLELPLDPEAVASGTVILEGVQLHDLVEASPFGDHMDLDAKVSGRIPFEVVKDRVRILGGELRAIQPGRLSIQRAALTGVQADAALKAEGKVPDPAASTDTFTDFAYQAMEHLAFETLEATLKSRDNGRLGVLFHIVGRHDPPTNQQIRLSLTDLIRKRYMQRKLPLPSGTGVNLTLDTTLNLDDLLSDYAAFRRTRSSGPVQP